MIKENKTKTTLQLNTCILNGTKPISKPKDFGVIPTWNCSSSYKCQWIGLRENLQETIDFPIKYGAFL
jgi:hypothetical protein